MTRTPILIGISIGFILGWALNEYVEDKEIPTQLSVTEHLLGQNGFINPLLECAEKNDINLDTIVPFREAMEKIIQEKMKSNVYTKVAVYFRDLNNGPTFGINTTEEFFPASLLKVPLLMGYYKKAEADPNFLKRKILFDGKNPPIPLPGQHIDSILEDNKEYTLEEILEHLIINSDNRAVNTLMKLDPKLELGTEVLRDIGIPIPIEDKDYKLDIKEYSTFFRVLYNATYLNKEYSNKALELLSRTTFKPGLARDLPPSVKIAHKFGERDYGDGDVQFHDCGIIYYPKNPYLLCIMSRGKNFDKLTELVADISGFVYKTIKQQK